MSNTYTVIFRGETREGIDRDAARQTLGAIAHVRKPVARDVSRPAQARVAAAGATSAAASPDTRSNRPIADGPQTIVTVSVGSASNMAFESHNDVPPFTPPQTILAIQPQHPPEELSLSAAGVPIKDPEAGIDTGPSPEIPSYLALSEKNSGEYLAPVSVHDTPPPDVPDLELERLETNR